jgi:Mg-chelatase subunit ChlD
MVQVALLAGGSLDPSIVRRLTGRPQLARRYLVVEGHRATRALEQALPGIAFPEWKAKIAPPTSSPDESLELALGRQPLADPPDTFGAIRPRRLLAADRRLKPAKAARTAGGDVGRDDVLPEFDEDAETQSLGTLAKLFSSPLGSGLAARLMKKLGVGREPGSGPAGAELPVGASRPLSGEATGGAVVTLSGAPAAGIDRASRPAQGWRYPEWDVHLGQYRHDWCTVGEYDPSPSKDPRPYRSSAAQLRRRLARLGLAMERHRLQDQGEDVDLDAVVRSRVEAAAGVPPLDGLYIAGRKTRQDLAVLLLLDVSGSVSETTSDRSVHERQTAAAGALLDALSSLGDRVALYGFRSHGRATVKFLRVKSFEDPLDQAAFNRLGSLSPGGYTRLGAAIRHGAELLALRSGTPRRMLVVLSDGFAYDDGYEGAYGEADARQALAEARRDGIGCLCLTLGSSTSVETLTRVFGTAAHARHEHLDGLTQDIGPLFRRALASADLQRRLGQRFRGEPLDMEGVA